MKIDNNIKSQKIKHPKKLALTDCTIELPLITIHAMWNMWSNPNVQFERIYGDDSKYLSVSGSLKDFSTLYSPELVLRHKGIGPLGISELRKCILANVNPPPLSWVHLRDKTTHYWKSKEYVHAHDHMMIALEIMDVNLKALFLTTHFQTDFDKLAYKAAMDACNAALQKAKSA
jgi:hypothetical protein